MTRVLVHGVRLEVRVAGEGPPLLLIHGFTGRASSWRMHVASLRRTHRVIVPDLLGHGRSDAPEDPARYALERQAADLAALLDAVGTPCAAVCGYSMGARIALQLAADQPDAVSALVLESPSAGIPDPDERAARRAVDDALADDIERGGMQAFVERWEALPLFASHASLPPGARARLRAERLSQRPAGLAGSLRGAGQGAMAPLASRLAGIAAPVLTIAGALDPAGLQRAAAIAAAVPHGRLVVIEGAGHAPHLERPAQFRHEVSGFLDAVGRAAAPLPPPSPAAGEPSRQPPSGSDRRAHRALRH